MTEHKITVQRTAHYYTIGKVGKHVEDFWLVCHGYGQLAKRFIRKFDVLDDGKTLVVAPEGLSKFYWERGESREPVASWMTREHRLDEIDDYTRYMRTLYGYFTRQLPKNVRINLLGFSQGVATQFRWILKEYPDFDRLIAWAGTLPDDLDYTIHEDYLKNKELHLVYGHQDQFLTPKVLEWLFGFAEKQKVNFKVSTFEGKHVMDREMLKLFR